MKLALIQLKGKNIEDYRETKEHILSLVRDCCQTDADLILLPECAFPGYFIGLCPDAWKEELASLKDSLSRLAGVFGKYIAAGLADEENGALYNRLIVYGRDGSVLAVCDKSNLWHFDSSWFTPGEQFPVFDTEFGRIGCMICADGRIPEIARCLALKGARLVLDAVNLVSAAAVPSQLSNQQYAFILGQRARENGVFLAVCDKCGTEDASVTMLGRSMVLRPDGSVLAECGPEKEEILTCEIDLSEAEPARKAALSRREPEFYSLIASPLSRLPALSQKEKSWSLPSLECYTGLVRFAFCSAEEYAGKAAQAVRLCQKANCRLTVLPYAKGLDLSALLSRIQEAVRPDHAVIAGYGEREASLIRSGQITFFQKRLDRRVEEIFPGVTGAVSFDGEPAVPENVRIQMLAGADFTVWFDDGDLPYYRPLMQTRAAENKMYLLRATPSSSGFSLACNPDGAVMTTTFCCGEQIVFALLFTAASKCKTVVPGTDILTSRRPSAYELLAQEQPSASQKG